MRYAAFAILDEGGYFLDRYREGDGQTFASLKDAQNFLDTLVSHGSNILGFTIVGLVDLAQGEAE